MGNSKLLDQRRKARKRSTNGFRTLVVLADDYFSGTIRLRWHDYFGPSDQAVKRFFKITRATERLAEMIIQRHAVASKSRLTVN
jgi:hypothetical protein